jgi:SMI1 / KNR4 family (SUKH-1)
VNGAFCGTQGFLGLNDYRVDSKYFLGRSWLPVADDGCGDYYVIDLTGPDQGDYPVFFWDHETGQDIESGALIKGYAVASNVWIFSLLFLKHELTRVGTSQDKSERWSWHFDRDRTLQHDPNLARVRSAPLPWKADTIQCDNAILHVRICDGFRTPARSLSARHHVGWSAGVRKPPMNETAGGGAPLSAGAMGIWMARSVQRRSRKAGAGADCWGDICGRYGDFALEGWRCKAGVCGNCWSERGAAAAFT